MAEEKRLSARGLLNIPRNASTNDFAFIIGGDRYECSRFTAAFLSPRLGELAVGGLLLDEFYIETDLTIGQFESLVSHCTSSFSTLSGAERRVFAGNLNVSLRVSE
jgi:hypothetical protein